MERLVPLTTPLVLNTFDAYGLYIYTIVRFPAVKTQCLPLFGQ